MYGSIYKKSSCKTHTQSLPLIKKLTKKEASFFMVGVDKLVVWEE